MRPDLSANERFLVDFHDRRAGLTSQVFMALPAAKGGEVAASLYDFLVALVPTAQDPLTLLDVACGDGYLLSLVAASRQAPATLIGVDISGGELAAASRRLGPRATLIDGRAQALPLPDAAADVVLCHMALMLMDDLDTVIAEVRRVLKPGGVFSFIVGARPPASAALDLYLRLLSDMRQRLDATIPRLGDRRLGDTAQIRQLLAGAFTDVTVEDIAISRRYAPPQLWSWFDGMYDMDRIPPHELALLKTDYLNALAPLCDSDGRVAFSDNFRLVRALAA